MGRGISHLYSRPDAPPEPLVDVVQQELESIIPLTARIREGAADTLLNSFSILGEVVEDFRSSDRFFKYKAMVIGLWFLLAIGSFGIACPSSGPSNDISAVLVVSGDIYMVKNDGSEPWQDVEIIVNGAYRSTMSQVAGGGNATLSSAVLFDEQGKRAPSKLTITDIVVKARDPEAEVTLLRGGAQPK